MNFTKSMLNDSNSDEVLNTTALGILDYSIAKTIQIKLAIDGFTLKIGEITYFLVDSSCNIYH